MLYCIAYVVFLQSYGMLESSKLHGITLSSLSFFFLRADVSSNGTHRKLYPLIIQYLFSDSMELTINSFMAGITKILHCMALKTMSVQRCVYAL